MTNKINDGGAAFPSPTVPIDRGIERLELEYGGGGMSLRDWYIGKAVTGFLSNPGAFVQANNMSGFGWCNCDEQQAAEACVSFADAIMKAREERP